MIPVSFGPAALQQGRVPPRILRILDEYLLLERLGAGGMGEVYLALQPQAGQYFALKLINQWLNLCMHLRAPRGWPPWRGTFRRERAGTWGR